MIAAALVAALSLPVGAQEAAPVERTDAEWQVWVPDPAEVTVPDLAFV